MNGREWTEKEDNYIRKNFGKLSFAEMAKELNRAIGTVQKRTQTLGFSFEKKTLRKWTDDEEKILIELAPKCHINEIAQLLNRSKSYMIRKAQQLGIEYITLNRNFSVEEIEYIKNNWGIVPVSEMARVLKVSRAILKRKAEAIGVPKLVNNLYQKWTEEEVNKLRILSKKKTITELAKYFKVTKEAVKTVAYRNNIKLINSRIYWTDENISLLKELASQGKTTLEIAEIMNKSTGAIRTQATRRGIIILQDRRCKYDIWTEEEISKLKELASQGKTTLEIAEIMNKKDHIISKEAKTLGIKIKRAECKEWTEEDVQSLILLSQTKYLSELSKSLGRTSAAIRQKAKKLGLILLQEQRVWTEEECKQLEHLVMVEKKTLKEIAKILDRTEDSITIKIHKMGLKIFTNDKRAWTSEEETLISDLWGAKPIESIAKKLNRSVSSLRNKAFQLGLGSQIESNYEGITIRTICELFKERIETVSIYWAALGLNIKTKSITQTKSYRYVEIKELFEFLKVNQNIWDSRVLEKNILGKEPEWLKQKRINDRNAPIGSFNLESLTKQQLIVAKKYFLDFQQQTCATSCEVQQQEVSEDSQQVDGETSPKLVKKKSNIWERRCD